MMGVTILDRNGLTTIFAISGCLMILITAIPGALAAEDDDAGSGSVPSDAGNYYFNGSFITTMSDSIGIDDTDYTLAWSLEDALGYAIVNNYVYVASKDGSLNKVDMASGDIVKSVRTGVSADDWPVVGAGLVLDPQSGNVYDLDLNQVYRIDASSEQAYYDDGHWYVVQRNRECKAFAVGDEDPASDTNVQTARWTSDLCFYIDEYTLPVSVAFSDKALFYPGIGADDTDKRVIYSVDKGTGVQLDSFEMTEIPSTFWNSGFISQIDGIVTVSTHWDNMFAPLGDGTRPVFVSIGIDDDGRFLTDSAKYICNGTDDSFSSCLVKIGDLGFAQTGRSFKVFDLCDGQGVIASTDIDTRLSKTYSNIVIATGTYGYVYGYVSPAGVPETYTEPTDGLICFEYKISTNEIRTFDLKVGEAEENTVSSIKIGPHGELVFMKGDSKVHCISQIKQYFTLRMDTGGGSAIDPITVEKGTLLQEPVDPVMSDYVFRGWQIDGNEVVWPYEITSDVTMKAVWGIGVTGDIGFITTRGENLEFSILKGNITSVQCVDEDGQVMELPEDAYEAGSDHSLTVSGDYTWGLSPGLYELRINTDEGVAYADFTIKGPVSGKIVMTSVVAVVSASVATFLAIIGRKE